MTEEEKIICAKDTRAFTHDKAMFAEKRSSEVADEFTRLEVQVAVVLFAFVGLFWGNFSSGLEGFTLQAAILFKMAFAASLFFLIASLGFGLLHLKRKEKFWNETIEQRHSRFLQWNRVAKQECTFEYADGFHQGASHGNNSFMSSTPAWTWILQTICLCISIALIFIISLVLLFS